MRDLELGCVGGDLATPDVVQFSLTRRVSHKVHLPLGASNRQ
jgi:hypothetical protein